MNMHRWVLRSAPVAAVLATTAAAALSAQSLVIGQPRVTAPQGGSELFEWSGQVDREIQIVMRNGQVWTNNVGQSERPRARTRSFGTLPRQDGQVMVRVLNGRGNVDVVQQPSRQNNYTTIVRITDPRAGSDSYRLAAYWEGYANGDVYRPNSNRDIYRDRDRDNNGNNRGVYGGNNRVGQELLHWSGNVDGELEIRIQQDGRVTYRNLSGHQPTSVRANVGSVNIRNGGSIGVVQNQGRGSITIIQQPSQYNGYATVLRVRDPAGGYGYYDFSLIRQ
jgi:hypothetical protein